MRESTKKKAVFAACVSAGIAAAVGFGTKIFEFVRSFLRGETEFALSSVSVYLMVALGFLCMFLWATLRGQFRDIEEPKRRMLEREAALDAGGYLREENS
jgi:nitrogen fixation-related uncharacterized protein